jgi:hypothetical protein
MRKKRTRVAGRTVVTEFVRPECKARWDTYEANRKAATEFAAERAALGTDVQCRATCVELLSKAGVARGAAFPARGLKTLLHGEVPAPAVHGHPLVAKGTVDGKGTLAVLTLPASVQVEAVDAAGAKTTLSTGAAAQVPAGTYVLTAKHEGFETQTRELAVTAGGEVKIMLPLVPIHASFAVTVPSAATVIIGASHAKVARSSKGAGVVKGEVQIGRRDVLIRAEGFNEWTATYDFERGKVLELTFPDCASGGILKVTSDPPGAAVTVGADHVGKTPITVVGYVDYTKVGVAADGHVAQAQVVQIKEGKTTSLDFDLENNRAAELYRRLSGIQFTRYPISVQTIIFDDPLTSMWQIPFTTIGLDYAWGNFRIPIFGFSWFTANSVMDQTGPSGHSNYFFFNSLGFELTTYGLEDLGSQLNRAAWYIRADPLLGFANGSFNGQNRYDKVYGVQAKIGWRGWGFVDFGGGAHWDSLNDLGLILNANFSFNDGPSDQ